MNRGRGAYSHLTPGYYGRPTGSRRSSASYSDAMSNMQREYSNSSHATESSETTSYVHTNIGDSILTHHTAIPTYIRNDPSAFSWNSVQAPLEESNPFITDDYILLPQTTQVPHLVIPNEADLNIEPDPNDADAVFESFISRIRQQYSEQIDRLAYVQRLFNIYLEVSSIQGILPSPEQPISVSRPRRPSVNSVSTHQKKEHYICLLCSPLLHLYSRGTFKRHVNEKHRSKSLFVCMHYDCDYSNPRKDKFREHLRIKHPNDPRPSSQEIKDRELMLDVPTACVLCGVHGPLVHNPPFESWDEWFEGIEMHCRVREDEDNQTDNGSNLPDQHDGNAGGSAGGSYPNSPFPQTPNLHGASLGQGNDWLSPSTPWSLNVRTRSGTQYSCESLKVALHTDASHDAGDPKDDHISNSKASFTLLTPGMKRLNIHDSLRKFRAAALSKLPRQIAMPHLTAPKDVLRLPNEPTCLASNRDVQKVASKKRSSLSNAIRDVDPASPPYYASQVSLYSHDKHFHKNIDDELKVVIVNPLPVNIKKIRHQYMDPSTVQVMQPLYNIFHSYPAELRGFPTQTDRLSSCKPTIESSNVSSFLYTLASSISKSKTSRAGSNENNMGRFYGIIHHTNSRIPAPFF